MSEIILTGRKTQLKKQNHNQNHVRLLGWLDFSKKNLG